MLYLKSKRFHLIRNWLSKGFSGTSGSVGLMTQLFRFLRGTFPKTFFSGMVVENIFYIECSDEEWKEKFQEAGIDFVGIFFTKPKDQAKYILEIFFFDGDVYDHHIIALKPDGQGSFVQEWNEVDHQEEEVIFKEVMDKHSKEVFNLLRFT